MINTYFVLEEGEQRGPFTMDELTEMGLEIHTRLLSTTTNTWHDACDLPEFYEYFESIGIYFPTGDNFASFGWRLLAYAVDYVILSVLLNVVFKVLASYGITFHLRSYNDFFKLPVTEILLLQLITSVTLIIYNSICEASVMRGSLGKRLCGLVVVDIEGMRLTYLNALLRSVGKALSIFLLYGGFLSILFSEHRQALHDYWANTYVVKRD